MTAVVGGRLVLEHEVVAGRLRIADGRIAAIERDDTEAAGPFIAPGFVDVHVHGFGGHDAAGDRAALDGLARALLRRGVTAFLPTAVTAGLDDLAGFAARVRDWTPLSPPDGATPLGFNLEGPFISSARAGAQNPAFIRSPAGLDLEAAVGPLLDGLRVMTVAPEIEGGLELIVWLASSGVAVSLGHSDATLDEGRAGYAAGARTTTHVFNAMSGASHHAPGLAVAALTDDDAYVELIADGEHVHPGLWPLILRAKPPGRLILVSDALAPAGTGGGRATLGGLEVEVRGARLTIAGTQTLAGSAIALDEAVQNLVRAGVALTVASAAASRNPLALLGVTDRGRIEVGQLADLVALDDALRVVRVARAGEWLRLA
jgi:N-acetylglucosamine-6-phosphate deacetylase